METGKSSSASSPLLKTINYILDTVDAQGAWGGADFEDWQPIITALTVELLLKAGFSPETEWTIVRGNSIQHVALDTSIQFLDKCIQENGTFGEDVWDAARFGRIIEEFDLKDRVHNYSTLKKNILDSIARGLHKTNDSTWSGPGTISTVVDYLDAAGEEQLARGLFQDLMALQFEDGSFHGPVNEVNDELVHPIWHTTQVLMTSLRRIPSQKDPKILKMSNFICDTQDKGKGCWRAFSRFDVYFTSYAIMALTKLTHKPTEVIQRAEDWLTSQISDSGKIRDAGGTIMGALALCSRHADQLIFRATLADLRRLDKAESLIEELNSSLKDKIEESINLQKELDHYKHKYGDADFVLTKADAFKWTLIIGVIGISVSFVLSIVPLWITNMSKEPAVIILKEGSQLTENQAEVYQGQKIDVRVGNEGGKR